MIKKTSIILQTQIASTQHTAHSTQHTSAHFIHPSVLKPLFGFQISTKLSKKCQHHPFRPTQWQKIESESS
jgi:hypothetical protein